MFYMFQINSINKNGNKKITKSKKQTEKVNLIVTSKEYHNHTKQKKEKKGREGEGRGGKGGKERGDKKEGERREARSRRNHQNSSILKKLNS